MTYMIRRLDMNNLSRVFRRYVHKEHWSIAKKKNKPSDKALEYFDDFYKSVYGKGWEYIRAAMLKEHNKHVAIVNNFADIDAVCEKLSLLGAMNVRELYEVHKESYEKRAGNRVNMKPSKNKKLEPMIKNKQRAEIEEIYPKNYEAPQKLMSQQKNEVHDTDETDLDKPQQLLDSVQLRPLEEDLAKAEQDFSRIIDPSLSLTSDSLYEYIPATQLKGLDDYVLESDHYNYYTNSSDFKIRVEKEIDLNIPEQLRIFTFEAANTSRFPVPRRTELDVYDYYLMDGASILPVLALNIQRGDRVLDMCAAPGGKSFAILQTLFTQVLVSNDASLSRMNRMNDMFLDYLKNYDLWENKLFLTNHDARSIEDRNIYNKILVDVPCTTDRHVLHNNENNIFSSKRIKERLQLPELQSEILLQALRIVAPGGTVVYSTCSLSPIQNDGVVQMAVKKLNEETGSLIIVKDIDTALGPLKHMYKFATDCGVKYGHTIIPTKNNNWGPMYFSKIVKLP